MHSSQPVAARAARTDDEAGAARVTAFVCPWALATPFASFATSNGPHVLCAPPDLELLEFRPVDDLAAVPRLPAKR